LNGDQVGIGSSAPLQTVSFLPAFFLCLSRKKETPVRLCFWNFQIRRLDGTSHPDSTQPITGEGSRLMLRGMILAQGGVSARLPHPAKRAEADKKATAPEITALML
jgi:hypothetical protein